jgi:cellulose synthase/poly-beta-1,6-N-acetylglucosamine synthase-like glycosyltransferase
LTGIVFWVCVALILYTYAGYPLLLALLAHLRPKPSFEPTYTPTVTLLIAAYNEQAVIARKLDNSLALDYPADRLQIVVAADGSDDQTREIVQRYRERGVLLSYRTERQGKMAAINHAMRLATGEIIVFSDANNLYAPDTLRRLAAPFALGRVGAVSGAKRIVADEDALSASEGLYWKYESFIKQQESRLGTCIGSPGEVFALRRNLFDPPPAQIINDDFYMAMQVVRKGYRVLYIPEARSYERASASAQDEITRRARIVAGRYQAMTYAGRFLTLRNPVAAWQVISHKFLRPLVPLGMAGALIANALAVILPPPAGPLRLLRLAPPYNWGLLTLQGLFYLAAWFGSAFKPGGMIGKALYLPTFLVNSNMAAVIGLYRHLTGRQTVLWERVARHED